MSVARVLLGLLALHSLACQQSSGRVSGSGGAAGGPLNSSGGAAGMEASGGAGTMASGGAGGTMASGGAGGTMASGGPGSGGATPASAGGGAAGMGMGPGVGGSGDLAGASGSTGAGGSAGTAGPPSSRSTLTLLEPFHPAQAPDLGRGLRINGASDDGTALVGISVHEYSENAWDNVFDAFVWTAPTGLVRIGAPPGTEASDVMGLHVSGDGRYVFGGHFRRSPTVRYGSPGIFRWSPSAGFTTIGDPEMISISIAAVSRDGTVAVGIIGTEKDPAGVWFRWTEEGGLRQLANTPGWPREGATLQTMSSDGAVLMGYSLIRGRFSPLRWTEDGFKDLGLLPGAVSCTPHQMTRDGSVIIGACTDGPVGGTESPPYDRSFRWSAASGMVELPLPPDTFMSSDGAVMMASDRLMKTLHTWTPNNVQIDPLPEVAGDTKSYGLHGISPDGSVGYGHRFTIEEGTEAFRYSGSGGFELLGFLPGDLASSVRSISRDGLVLGGLSRPTWRPAGNVPSHAVIWDAHGIRDVAGELRAAGIDLSDILLFDVARVWAGSTAVLVGSGSKGKASIAWIATLPARP